MAGKRWTDKELKFLIDHYGVKRCDWCAEQLGRSKRSVYTMAERLGISVEWSYERIDKDGYLEICLDSSIKVRYHRYVMESYLGRKLDSREHVHHLDLDKLNNDVDNLIIINPTIHNQIHAAINRNDKNYLETIVSQIESKDDQLKFLKWLQNF